MQPKLSTAILLSANAIMLVASHVPLYAQVDAYLAVSNIIDDRCMSCHDSDVREGGVDLSPLLKKSNSSHGKFTRLWSKLEDKVARDEMPPPDDGTLTREEKDIIQQWFREAFVLREGKPHVGPTPLRRLTRYELKKTLEDTLSIQFAMGVPNAGTESVNLSPFESLVPSDIPGDSGFDNDAYRMGKLKPPLKAIANGIRLALTQFNEDPTATKTVLGRESIPADTNGDEIKEIISKFVLRAYRSKPEKTDGYVNTFYKVYQKHREKSQDSRASLFYVFEVILLSPEFLYRFEESKGLSTPYAVSGVELANRLSYFLWSSPPDAELLQVGRDETLLEDDILDSQIDRMLNSPKRLALSENFAGQWLGFSELLSNGEYLLSTQWNIETHDEVLYFFDELIKRDKSIMELVQSDWVYKRGSALRGNRHGYQRVDASQQKNRYKDILPHDSEKKSRVDGSYQPPVLVKTKDAREGGVITSAAIMRLTASRNRTSPIRRGVWVLSKIIGKDLEAPPNVPPLEEAREALQLKKNPSVAELIKQHVSKPECTSCHQTIDPLGLGLENFSPTGDWRRKYPDKAPVESAGVMPNGDSFSTPAEMKELLLKIYRDDIARNFVEQMFAYSVGRKIEPFDRVSLERIMRAVKKDDYKINTIIKQIVLSPQFRCRQDR